MPTDLPDLKWSSDRLVFRAKGFLKLSKLLMLIKQKNLSLHRYLVLVTLGELLIAFLIKVNLAYVLCLMVLGCCRLYPIKKNCLLKTFLKTLNVYSWCKRSYPTLTSSKPSGPWFYRSCVSEEPWKWTSVHTSWTIQYVKSCFSDCWKVSSVVPLFKIFGRGLRLKTTALLDLFLRLVKSLKNL